MINRQVSPCKSMSSFTVKNVYSSHLITMNHNHIVSRMLVINGDSYECLVSCQQTKVPWRWFDGHLDHETDMHSPSADRDRKKPQAASHDPTGLGLPNWIVNDKRAYLLCD